jgi:hypothetical protein
VSEEMLGTMLVLINETPAMKERGILKMDKQGTGYDTFSS